MRITIICLLTGLILSSYSQTIYEVTPGTKGNQIVLSLSNISEITDAEGVLIKLSKVSSNLYFEKKELLLEKINVMDAADAVFSFDIKRGAPINVKDTIEFVIIDNKGIFIQKQFVLNYTRPEDYGLEQNFPNPFNPATTIHYQLPVESKVTLKVYDIIGNEIVTLTDEVQVAGYKEIKFDASSFSSGVYIYRLAAESYIFTKKMIVLK